MTEALPISIFLICLNEANRIGDTLSSVQGLATEIIVVDSGSSDGTQAIAAQHGAKVIHHDWPGYGPQKRFAEEQCTQDWVFNLDADEVPSDALIEEIRSIFAATVDRAEGGLADGYQLSIRDCLPGESRHRRFAHTTKAVRLYNKTKGRYADSPVHDRVKFVDANPRIQPLSAPVYHHSSTSVEQVIAKLNRYSTMQAADMHARGRTPNWLGLRLITEFPIAFLKSYILRGDILRGRNGFSNAMLYAFSRFARVAKVWEKNR